MGVIATLRQDYANNPRNPKGRLVLTLFRLAHAVASRKESAYVLWLLGVPYLVMYRVIVEWFLGVEIPPHTRLGPGITLFHGQGLVINDHTVIGRNCVLRHNTTIGCVMNPDRSQGPSPVIGDEVEIGANVVILGGITIGNRAVIGAGSVVVKDVPYCAVVVGNPARVIKVREAEETSDARADG